MDVNVALVRSLFRMLSGDPITAQLHQLNAKVDRLLQGYMNDGLSALEDCLHQSNTQEIERLLLIAIEYFRQAHSRGITPWASLAAEYVARCYLLLGRSEDAQRWFARAAATCQKDRLQALRDFYLVGQPAHRVVTEGLRSDFRSGEFGVWMRALFRGQRDDRPIDYQDDRSKAFTHLLLLEFQARRLEAALNTPSRVQFIFDYLFPPEATRAVMKWDNKQAAFAFSYDMRDGSSRYFLPSGPIVHKLLNLSST